jgi:manganese/zinc/iron transport system permease protein
MAWTFSLRVVLLGASLLGVVGGVLGCFALLRRQSLLGDALAHAALPGVCLAFLLTAAKAPLPLLLGAMGSGLAGAFVILAVVRWSRVKEDSAIGIVLSVFFGLGIVLLTRIQRLPGGNQSGLQSFLFGQAAALMWEDVRVMAVVAAVVLLAITLLYKELQLATFDRGFAASLGLPVRMLDVLITGLLVAVVVIGLQTVGVVLMVATLITPAAAARQWTDRLGVMMLLAAIFGGVSGAAGAVLSANVPHLPTGPTIVLVLAAVLAASLLVSPGRGVLWAALAERRVRERVRRENLLKDLYLLAEASGDFERFVSTPSLMGLRGQRGGELGRNARRLVAAGLAEASGEDLRLSPRGIGEAERLVRKHRLWEVYLARRLELPPDHVHRDAEAMEHALSDAAVEEIEARLGYPAEDPHGRRIPPRRTP